MATSDDSQMSLDLEIPERVPKKSKGYYIPETQIQAIKDTADDLGKSENEILTAIIHFYYKRGE